MKISDIFNELPKRYSFSLLAYSGFLFVLELLCFPVVDIIVESLHKGYLVQRDFEEFLMVSAYLFANFFLSLLILKSSFIIKWFLREKNNPEFRISLKFTNNIFYKVFFFLSLVFSLITVYCCIYYSFGIALFNENVVVLTKIYYYHFAWIIILYLLLTKSQQSIKTDIFFYIFYYIFSLSYTLYCIMP